ncbi:hypothetical protein T05_8287 [Trichinella murrelli]|uniref:Uncharacterized protein n=1 Tax=Trichinella murrelli TaxID=144512 RepID=A0A0V0T8B6_9BILA|nr:hypothetical protein T05_8287 [Trichinella murrelli]
MDYSQPMALIAFPTVLMFFLITHEILLSQSRSVRTHPDNLLLNSVRMHVKAFPIRPSVPLLITNS